MSSPKVSTTSSASDRISIDCKPHRLAPRMAAIEPSPFLAVIRAIRTIEAAGRTVVNLSMGEPDFKTPEHVKAEGIRAIRDDETRYTAMDGTAPLKEAIRLKLRRDNNLDYDAQDITVTLGGTQAIFNTMMATVGPGDEVVLPAPYFQPYDSAIRLAEGTTVPVRTTAQNGFVPTAADIEAAITPKTRWIVLNSPSNPTGAVIQPDQLGALAEVIRRHPHILVFSDDIYESILFDPSPFQNVINVAPDLRDRVVILNGVSKAYAMTGWRVGYLAGPRHLIEAVSQVSATSTFTPCSITQAAAAVALSGPQAIVRKQAAIYQHRRDMVIARLSAIPGLSVVAPKGAFYAFPNCSGLYGRRTPEGNTISSDLDVVMHVLSQAGLALVHGSAFGVSDHFRLSFAASDQALRDGMGRLEAACAALT